MERNTINNNTRKNEEFFEFFENSINNLGKNISKEKQYISKQLQKHSSPLKYNIGVNLPQGGTSKKKKYKENNFKKTRNKNDMFIRNTDESKELNNNKKQGIKLNYEINDYFSKGFKEKRSRKNKSKNNFLNQNDKKISNIENSNSTAKKLKYDNYIGYNCKKFKSNQNLGLQLTLKTSEEIKDFSKNKLIFSSSLNNIKKYTNQTSNNISSKFSQTINTNNLSIKLPYEESMKNEIIDILNLNNNIKIDIEEINNNKNLTHSHSNKSFSFTKRKKPLDKNKINFLSEEISDTYKEEENKIMKLEKEIQKIKQEYNKIKYEKTNLETSNMIIQNEMKFFFQQKEIEKDNFEKYKQNEIKKLAKEKNKIEKETKSLNELKKKYQFRNLENDEDYIVNNKINDDDNRELIEIYKNKLNEANDEILKLKNILKNLNINSDDKKLLQNFQDNQAKYIENLKNNTESNKSIDEYEDDSEDNDDDNYDLVLPDKYHKEKYNLIKTEKNNDESVIKTYDKNKIEINLKIGDRKEIYDDKYEIVYYSNGDISQLFKDKNKQVFFFKKQNITKTTLGKGLQIIKYNDINQLEKIFSNGTKKISFSDGRLKYILPNGVQETYFPDGSVERISKDGNINLECGEGIK